MVSGSAREPPGSAAEGGRRAGRGAALRVLGIDPGLVACGYGVLDVGAAPGGAGVPAICASGALCPVGEGAARLVELHRGVTALVRAHAPDAAAVELLYHNRNVRTAAAVGQARGVVLLALAQAGVPVAEYTPTEVKLAVTGYGGASKQQVRAMVQVRLRLSRPPSSHHAADALGLCLCHLQGEALRRRLAARGGRSAPLPEAAP